MQTISILGCGWLGFPLGTHLAQKGYLVKGSTTYRSKLERLEIAGIKPYLLSFNPELAGNESDFFDADMLLINLPPRNKNGNESFHQNQLSTIHQLATNKSKRIIFISSTAVYSSENQEVIEADANEACLTRGGISLLKMERLFSKSTVFDTTILRFGGLYGPDRHPGRFLAGKKDLAGANNPINMIHLEDCIGVIQTIIEKNQWGETFNACSPSQETRQSFYQKAAKELKLEAPTFSDKPAAFKKVISEKLIKLTGYQFKY